ncbi:MAG TPA: hypothetical protein VFN70_18085 [Burkholderiales bacterium]|nr:hypothetical protein [Burkholderiales bacterium]
MGGKFEHEGGGALNADQRDAQRTSEARPCPDLCSYCDRARVYTTDDGIDLCGDVRCGNAYREGRHSLPRATSFVACVGCGKDMAGQGCDDDMPLHCDACWAKVHRPARRSNEATAAPSVHPVDLWTEDHSNAQKWLAENVGLGAAMGLKVDALQELLVAVREQERERIRTDKAKTPEAWTDEDEHLERARALLTELAIRDTDEAERILADVFRQLVKRVDYPQIRDGVRVRHKRSGQTGTVGHNPKVWVRVDGLDQSFEWRKENLEVIEQCSDSPKAGGDDA